MSPRLANNNKSSLKSSGPASRSGSANNLKQIQANNNNNPRSSTSVDRGAAVAIVPHRGSAAADEDALLVAFERGRVDDERCNLEQKSIAIRSAFDHDASDIVMAHED